MADVFSREKRRMIMQAVRRKNTAPELALSDRLRALGIKFRTHEKHLPGQPDIYLPAARTVIFVHGCFWHGHQACRKGRTKPRTRSKYWQEKVARNQRRDRRVARKLRAQGLRVFTIWECEVRRCGIPGRVLAALQSCR